MATNPSIILSGNNINDIIADGRAKLAQATAQQGAQQLQDLQVAQAKQAAQDEKNFRQAFVLSKGDPNLTVSTAMKLGVSPTRIQAFQKSQSEILTQQLTQRKTKLEGDKTQLDIDDAKNSEIHGAIQPLLNAKTPEEFERAKPFVLNQLKSLATPEQLAAATNWTPDTAKLFDATLLNVKQLSDQAKGNAATSNAESAATQADVAKGKLAIENAKFITEKNEKAQVDTANQLAIALRSGGPVAYGKVLDGITDQHLKSQFKSQQDIALMKPADAMALLDDASMTGHERAEVQQAKANLVQTQARDANTAANELANLKLRQTEVAISAKREAREESQVGLNVGPDGISPTAKNIFDGLTDPQTVRAMIRKNPGLNDQIIKYAESKGQKWDEGAVEGRFNTIKELTNTSPNKPGGTILAASKMVQHAQLFKDAVRAISNGSFVPGNAAYNAFSSTFGAPEPNNLKLIGEFLGSEAAKAATGNAPQKAKLEAIGKALSNDKSERTLMSAADTLVSLGAEGLHSVKELADSHQIGDDVVRIVSPDTAEVLKSAGYDPKTLKRTQATQATAAKVATLDDVKAYARQASIPTEQAVKMFTDGGYKVQ